MTRFYEALAKAERLALGHTRARRARAMSVWRRYGRTPSGIVGFTIGHKYTDDGDTGRDAVRIVVPKKRTTFPKSKRVRRIPAELCGLETDVVESAELGALDDQAVEMGTDATLAVSAEIGTLSTIIGRNGQSYAVTCSHVLHPLDSGAPTGALCYFAGATLEGALTAWTPLADKVTADCAIASVDAAPLTSWPDGTAVGEAGFDAKRGPFDVFGRFTETSGGCDSASLDVDISLDESGKTIVTYLDLFRIAAPIQRGDSGAPVRDSANNLVGMVVGRDETTGYALCTRWTAVLAAIVALAP